MLKVKLTFNYCSAFPPNLLKNLYQIYSVIKMENCQTFYPQSSPANPKLCDFLFPSKCEQLLFPHVTCNKITFQLIFNEHYHFMPL